MWARSVERGGCGAYRMDVLGRGYSSCPSHLAAISLALCFPRAGLGLVTHLPLSNVHSHHFIYTSIAIMIHPSRNKQYTKQHSVLIGDECPCQQLLHI